MAMTLYHFNNSVCSEKVRLVLHEKGITDWESHELEIFRGEHFAPEYLKLNPKAVVPTLVDDNGVLTESSLIAEYLDDSYPDPPLKPSTPYQIAQMRLYGKACDEGLHQGVGAFSYAGMFIDRLRDLTEEEVARHFERVIDLDRRDRQLSVYREGADSPVVYRGTVSYEKIFQKIDKALADGRTWLMGNQFTLSEINLAPYLARLEHMDLLEVWLSERPAIIQWFRRIQQRDSYKAEVDAWIREKEWQEMRKGGARVKPSLVKFREHYLSTDYGAAFF